MMKLIILVLFFTIFSAQSKITSLNNISLIKAGDPVTLFCDKPKAEWRLKGYNVADCTECPSSACYVYPPFNGRINASCDERRSILHFKSTKVGDNGLLQCRENESKLFRFLVGRYDDHLHPEDPEKKFALNRQSFSLICDKQSWEDMKWYNQTGDVLSYLSSDCENIYQDYEKEKFDITCDKKQSRGKLQIKSVSLEDDGQIFGCESGGNLSLYRLTVNVTAPYVLIKQQSKSLVENKEGQFICDVIYSEPVPSHKWIIVDKDNKEEIQTTLNMNKTLIGNFWHTTSYLKLKLKKDYRKIKCRARIAGKSWEYSADLLLDILYPPDGKPTIIMPQSEICSEKEIEIKCEWKGGKPEATLRLECLSGEKKGGNSISIQRFVPRKSKTSCICYGTHIGRNAATSEKLDFHNAPHNVTIDQTSYLEGQNASLICNAIGGYPAVFNYTWSPGEHPHKKTIEINLTKGDNKKEFTCKVIHECSGGNPVSSTRELKVEYSPDIVFSKDVTKLKQKAQITCTAQANPININYTLVQKWGETIKKKIATNEKDFNNLSFEDLGTWTCEAGNGVPSGDYYAEKSVKIEVDVPAHFKFDKNEIATFDSSNKLKVCFYCNPSATEVKWYKEDEEVSPHRITYSPAVDGEFPFTGNCSILNLDIKEKNIQMYSLQVTNPVGKEIFKMPFKMASDSGNPDNKTTNIIIACVVVAFIITGLIGGIFFIRNRRFKRQEQTTASVYENIHDSPRTLDSTDENQAFHENLTNKPIRKDRTHSNNNLHENNSVEGLEMVRNSLYGEAFGITNKTENLTELYAKVNKSKETLTPDKNVSNPELIYANEPRKILNQLNNANVEELYAQVDKSKKTPTQDKKANVEELYAQVDKSKKTPPQDKKDASSKEEINENLNMKMEKANKGELMYAALEFTPDKTENKKDSVEKSENPTMYASIDFLKTEAGN